MHQSWNWGQSWCCPSPHLNCGLLVAEVVCNPGHYVVVHLHDSELLHKHDVERNGKVKECVSYSASWLLQVWVSPVQQVDNGVIHADIGLVCKLQKVQGPKVLQNQSSWHVMSAPLACHCCECWNILSWALTMQEVFYSWGTFFNLKEKLSRCWNTSASCPGHALSTIIWWWSAH